MAKYKNIDIEYHPRDVSFEVEAMLMDEEEEDSYERSKEHSFNPVTEKEEVEEYIEYKHKTNALYDPELDFAGEKEAKQSSFKKLAKLAHKKVKQAFEAVFQAMLIQEDLESRERLEHETLKETKEIHREFIHDAPQLKDVPHPHVDAVLREHSHIQEHERFRE